VRGAIPLSSLHLIRGRYPHSWEGEAPAEPLECSNAVRLSRSFALPACAFTTTKNTKSSPRPRNGGEGPGVSGAVPLGNLHLIRGRYPHPWEGEAPAEPPECSNAVRLSRSFALPACAFTTTKNTKSSPRPRRQRCEAFSGLSMLLVLSEFSKLFGG